MRRWFAASVAVLALAALGGCGDGDRDDPGAGASGGMGSGAPPATDAAAGAAVCSLLTAAEVEAELGGDYAEGEAAAVTQCTWRTTDGSGTFNLTHSPNDFATTKAALTGAGTELKVVTGVGDEAYFFVSPVVAQLGVGLRGTTYVFGYGGDIDGARVEAQLTALARVALARA